MIEIAILTLLVFKIYRKLRLTFIINIVLDILLKPQITNKAYYNR